MQRRILKMYNKSKLTVTVNCLIGAKGVQTSLPASMDEADRDAPFSVDAPGCGTSVVQGLTGNKKKKFSSWGTTNVKNMHLHRDSNPAPWNTVPML